jgi:hypothetical protein
MEPCSLTSIRLQWTLESSSKAVYFQETQAKLLVEQEQVEPLSYLQPKEELARNQRVTATVELLLITSSQLPQTK